MNNTSIKVIGKYALLLIVFYAIEIIVSYSIDYIIKDFSDLKIVEFLYVVPTIVMYLLNIVTAFIIHEDKNRLEIDGRYSVLLTIFYRPIGIVLFLIYVINKEINEKPAHNKG